VLHATRDQPVALDIIVDAADAGYRGGVADRLGEAFLRVALANAPADDTGTADATVPNASTAAAGWGEDALVVLRRNGTTNNAWVLRFDTARDATEARDVLAAVLDARGDRADDHADSRWRLPDATAALHHPANRTVVLAVGTRGFVADLAVTATPGNVTVVLDDANANATRNHGIATPGTAAGDIQNSRPTTAQDRRRHRTDS